MATLLGFWSDFWSGFFAGFSWHGLGFYTGAGLFGGLLGAGISLGILAIGWAVFLVID